MKINELSIQQKKLEKKMNKIYTSKAKRGNELKINARIYVFKAD